MTNVARADTAPEWLKQFRDDRPSQLAIPPASFRIQAGAAVALPAELLEPRRGHRVEWTIAVSGDGAGRIDGQVVCDGPSDSWCRKGCLEGTCHPGQTSCGHPLVSLGRCLVAEDINRSGAGLAEFYSGDPTSLRSGLITVGWDRSDDCFVWSYAAEQPPPPPAVLGEPTHTTLTQGEAS